jgi:protein involved in polysaccharide export with SLBB domain
MFWVFRQGVYFVIFSGLLLGCSTSDTTTVESQVLFKNSADAPILVSKLVVGDSIELSVEVEGTMEVRQHRSEVNHQGMVTLPLVGDLKIGGMKIDEAKRTILKTYGAYYVNPPIVMLALVNDDAVSEWGTVTVLGKVASPGPIALRSSSGIKLTEAINGAGGFSGSAKKSDIRISRVHADGRKVRTSVDYEEIGLEGNAKADIKLIDGDIIYVPERIF